LLHASAALLWFSNSDASKPTPSAFIDALFTVSVSPLAPLPCAPEHVRANDGYVFRLPLRITDAMYCAVLLCFGNAFHADEKDLLWPIPATLRELISSSAGLFRQKAAAHLQFEFLQRQSLTFFFCTLFLCS
jgi:hypothetical protein